MKISTSDAMIAAAEALKLGAAEHIVAAALRGDGFSPARVDLMIRWCKLHNERTAEDAIESDQGSTSEDPYNLYGDR
jgi:hypothetical protein